MQDRAYQSQAVAELFGYFDAKAAAGEPAGNPLILMPTGTGKSVVIARCVQRMMQWPQARIIIATHVKELVEQNAKKLKALWPAAPIGIYSAGLKAKQTFAPITFAGVGTLVKGVDLFGHIDVLYVDEAHRISPDEETQYRQVIAKLLQRNPRLKVIGLSATGYRKGQGKLTDEGGIFTDVAVNMVTPEWFQYFFAMGYLVPPIPKRTKTQLDVTSVSINRGEFNASQLQTAVDTDEINYKALTEVCELGYDRQAWLIFCSGIEHAEHCAQMLQSFGVSAAAVHSKMPTKLRDERIAMLRAGKLRAVTNNGVLTTGFDHPPIDLIALLRPTLSTVLHVQMIGRGMRPYSNQEPTQYIPGYEFTKSNCLVLDFAGNTENLGPIDAPCIPRKPGDKEAGDPPVKVCPACNCYNYAAARHCAYCGHEFDVQNKLSATAKTTELISGEAPIVQKYDVNQVIYNRHLPKGGGPAMIRVVYVCGMMMFNEYIGFEHNAGMMKKKALDWWRKRFSTAFEPTTTDEALAQIQFCRKPTKVSVWVNKKFPEVLNAEFEG